MPSPFPGMDPYLEGPLWPDVHQALAGEVRRQLNPRLGEKYAARLNVRIEVERQSDDDPGLFWADVDVRTAAPGWAAGPDGGVATTPATGTLPLVAAVHWKLVTVEVRDRDRDEVVTAIEILSPVNKRRPGLLEYRRKRRGYWEDGVHLVEIDLLRRGVRPAPAAAGGDYRVTLTEAGRAELDFWAFGVRDPLPTVPVPLLDGDGPVALDLAAAFRETYDAAAYDRSVDYAAPPPPPAFAPDDAAWIAGLLADRRPS